MSIRQKKNLLIAVLAFFSTVFYESRVVADEPSFQLISALMKVESGGNDGAIGDKHLAQKAYGCLQIRQPCVDDVNRRYGTKYKAEDCLNNRALSIWICCKYIDMYATESRLGRTPTDEDKARIWNGGPIGCFDNGSLDKNGRKSTSEKTRLAVARLQRNAKSYWQDKVSKSL